MKVLRALLVLLPIVLLFVFNLNCKDDGVNGDLKPALQHDTYDNVVELFVDEYVLVTPNSTPPYYQWRQVAAYSCSNCFNPPVINLDSFVTPAASRYDDNGDLVQTQYFKYITNASWTCQSIYHAAYWKIYRGGTTYYEHWEPFTGSTANCSPNNVTGSYALTINNQSLPASSTINVKYGVDIITDNLSH